MFVHGYIVFCVPWFPAWPLLFALYLVFILDRPLHASPYVGLRLPMHKYGVLKGPNFSTPTKGDLVFELKQLPDTLKYAYLDEKKIYPVIISANLLEQEEESY